MHNYYSILRRINMATIGLTVIFAAGAIYLVPFGWMLAAALVIATISRRAVLLTSYGTARWASLSDVRRAGMLEGEGLIVGHMPGRVGRMEGLKSLFDKRLDDREADLRFLESCQGVLYKPENMVRLSSAVHTTIVAPTGVGKNVSCVTPFLLTCEESCVVIDPKGESYNLTSETRRRMGHRIVRLDPFSVCGSGGDSLNPLEFIDPESPTAFDECNALAKAIVIRTGEEKDPHWPNMAEAFIGGFIGATVAYADKSARNLQTVRTLLTNPQKMQKTIEMMCGSDKWQGMLARRGGFLSSSKDRELASTLTNTNTHMSFLDTIPIANVTRNSSFNPVDLRHGRMTIDIILPPEHMHTQASWMRLVISSLMQSIIQGGLQEKNKVHWLIDEAKLFGKFDLFSEMLTIGRGYGIRQQLYYQDFGQILECWPNGGDQTLLANSTLLVFGVNDHKTAEMVSNKLGKHTIVVNSGGTSYGESYSSSKDGGSSSRSTNVNSNWSQAAREMLRPEEVTNLSRLTALTFAPGLRPIATTLVRHLKERPFKMPRRMGPIKIAVHTSCLFLAVVFVIALFAGALYYHNLR